MRTCVCVCVFETVRIVWKFFSHFISHLTFLVFKIEDKFLGGSGSDGRGWWGNQIPAESAVCSDN